MKKRGRPPKLGKVRRVQFHLSPAQAEILDRYSPDQISQLVGLALEHFTPDSRLGMSLPILVRPEKLLTETIARIQIHQRLIQIVFPEKREDFRALMMQFCYVWDGTAWSRTINEGSDLCDRASEIAHELLLKGFCVQVQHTEIQKRIVSVDYTPEAFRFIDASKDKPYEGWFTFRYPRSEDWYNKIMRLTASKYADGKICIPPEHFAEVEDFAEQKDFQFTPAALGVLERAKQMWESAFILQPQKRKCKDRPANPLDNIEVEIPSNLRDDDP